MSHEGSRVACLALAAAAASLAYGAAQAVEVTLFYASGSGGFGYLVRRPWFVDGVQFVEIKGGERVTIDLPVGKHTFRNQRNTTSPHVIKVDGPMVIQFGEVGFAEAMPQSDPNLMSRFEETKAIEPTAFAVAK